MLRQIIKRNKRINRALRAQLILNSQLKMLLKNWMKKMICRGMITM
jgi:hypothetical protein